jgi:Bacterial regulatory proteins, luxR family
VLLVVSAPWETAFQFIRRLKSDGGASNILLGAIGHIGFLLLADGARTADIGAKLRLSIKTVVNLHWAIKRKLNVENDRELRLLVDRQRSPP